jgi:FtsH-binding integral membrane protein
VTLVITIGVTIFAIQTKFDFTSSGCVLFICCISLAFIGFGFACLIVSLFTRIPVLQAVYGGLGALLMAIFLAFDTQMIMGGRRMQFSEEDYVNAALQLYLDICQMFMFLLQAFGSNK